MPTDLRALWRIPFLTLLALALVLAACGDDDDGAGGAVDSGADTEEDTPDERVDADEDADSEADDDTADDDAEDDESAGGADCLVGSWEASPDQILEYYADLLPAEISVVSASAPYTLTFDAESYEWLPAGTQVMDIAGTQGTADIGGNITGNYAVDGDVITTSLNEPNISIQVTVQGVTVDGSDFGASILESAPINDATFDCSSGDLVLATDNGGVQGTLELSRAG